MQKRNTPPARFAVIFMLALAAISGGVYAAFSTYQRAMLARRRESSAANLSAIHAALQAYRAKNGGHFPERAAQLLPGYLTDDSVLIHEAWPEQPGYVYIPGVRTGDSEQTAVVYENVPERKRKLGIQVLRLSGETTRLDEAAFLELMNAQETRWRDTQRVWMPEEMVPRGLK